MARFNKHLSQLEAIYGVAPAVVSQADPTHISDYIHHMFENKSEYGIESDRLDKFWFVEFSHKNPKQAHKFVNNALNEAGHIVSHNSIMEGIQKFSEGFSYDK